VIDTHTHVTSCPGSPRDVVAAARAAGVARLITVGSSSREMAEAAALADLEADVFVTAGLHPSSAGDWSDAVAGEIERRAAHPRCVAIGETGLDWFRADRGDTAVRDLQLAAFHGQIELARRLDLPLTIHCRDADAEVFEILDAAGAERVVLHCFSYPARLQEAVDRGWYCSFAGNVTYGSAAGLADAAAHCPEALLLLETDAPYLSPVPHRGRPNEPANVIATLAFVAGRRGVSPEALAAVVDANATRAFRLPS
jgi:TatD DNase family protein